jgi:hypothetical protein
MRLSLALAATLLFATSIALADSPSPGDQPQSGQSAQGDQGRQPRDARKIPASDPSGPHLTRSIMPGYHIDPDTEADCYYLSGDLHCDRFPTRHPHQPKKPADAPP